jgi:hypothetical protein
MPLSFNNNVCASCLEHQKGTSQPALELCSLPLYQQRCPLVWITGAVPYLYRPPPQLSLPLPQLLLAETKLSSAQDNYFSAPHCLTGKHTSKLII